MNNEFDIAIVGMAGRFPGARNVDEFWHNLKEGVESIARLSDQEILASGVPASHLAESNYVKAAPVLEEPGGFDAAFFGFSPMEARSMDPQHRILLELAHEALENAGHDPDRFQGRVGVFTGSALNTYFTTAGLNGRLAEDYIPTLIGNDKDFLSTRISYKLNLKGPSLTVQTACSTSIVAVHLARQSLLGGETDMALAGAISVRVPHRAGYFCDAGGVVSPDGHVRAFDAKANGTVFGSGGGILVLRRLADAIADGDTIHAVIRGSAVNNDGSEKAGYTAPSVNSQADVVVEALANAGVEADSVSYIETHGSGTPVGDPIEMRALTKAFRTSTQRSGYCAIGSVKTNIGHLDAAAGVAGIIKTVLALQHREIPPSLHYKEPNPEIGFADTPFFVNARLREWTSDGPRRAGVMSTGMGGTNAHVVLEEAPEQEVAAEGSSPHLLTLSAKTDAALDQATIRLREFLKDNQTVNMSDVAHTLQVGRKAHSHRRCLVCVDREDGIAGLDHDSSKRMLSGRADESKRPIVLLLPGIGDHYVGMAHDLYETWSVFRQEVDRCAEILEPHLGIDIRSVIYPESRSWKKEGKSKGIDLKKMLAGKSDTPQEPETVRLNTTLYAQPALFTIEYAMARLWQSLGITPDAIVGHSMGEYVAACLAGVLSLEDALRLIATRAKLVNELPLGAMLAVALPESELIASLPAELSIALLNGPNLCVVAGLPSAVTEFERMLNARSVICRHVQNAHAFHSRMLDPIVKAFEAEVRKVRLNEPRIPYISNVSGTWIRGREATDPAYWAMHANHTARFSDALNELWNFENPILLEAGPGRTLGVLAMQHPHRQHAGVPVAVSSIRHHYENQSDIEFLWHAIGKLWVAGADIRWEGVHVGGRPQRMSLPTYPFERQDYWCQVAPDTTKDATKKRPPEKLGVDDWFYVPTWERTPFPNEIAPKSTPEDTYWLIVADQYGGGACIKSRLQAMRQPVEIAHFRKSTIGGADGPLQLNPTGIDDYLSLFRGLKGMAAKGINVVHLGSLTRDGEEVTHQRCAANQSFGFYSLLHIAQAIGELDIEVPIKIGIISNRIHEVTGDERLDPSMATILGPCGVIPKEFPNVQCFNVDLPDDRTIEDLPDEVLTAILSEFAEPSRRRIVAYRGRHRWQRAYEQIVLPRLDPLKAPTEQTEVRRLRRGGVYLITGGTGGIGLSVARYLAEACQAKIVLTKKTPFPQRSRWKELLAAGGAPDPVLRTLKAIEEIEALGAEVEVVIADSSDRNQMQDAIARTRTKFKSIHGVIHGAGIVRAGLIQTKTKEGADNVLAPKVYGAMVLFDLLKNADLDFLVLFSSITSVITPYAESDYSAANAFLDAFAQFANRRTRFRTLAINWPGWREVGQLADLEIMPGLRGWKEAALQKAICTADGLEAFKRALNSDVSQIVVSPQDLEDLVAESESPFDHARYLSNANDIGKPAPLRGDLENQTDQPTDDVEAHLAEIWRNVFGFERIDINDNFSQLGGHSLLAMQIVAKIRSSYQTGLTLREFFEAPTIARLSAVVQTKIAGGGDGPTGEIALNVLSPMGQRSFSATRVQTPLFLGSNGQRVFAIHHPPVEPGRRSLTVICPPLFNEYMRTQLALRELAISLAEKGQHVIRFDYRGTGDSSCDLDQVAISDWLEDIALVVREGRSISGCDSVRILGVRAGALLACRSASASGDFDRLVLWDPILDGSEYLRALQNIQIEIAKRNLSRLSDAPHEYAGYRISERMEAELRVLSASELSTIPEGKAHIVSTSPDAPIAMRSVAQDAIPFACNWETDLEDLMMPKRVLERLSECLTRP